MSFEKSCVEWSLELQFGRGGRGLAVDGWSCGLKKKKKNNPVGSEILRLGLKKNKVDEVLPRGLLRGEQQGKRVLFQEPWKGSGGHHRNKIRLSQTESSKCLSHSTANRGHSCHTHSVRGCSSNAHHYRHRHQNSHGQNVLCTLHVTQNMSHAVSSL